MFSCWIVIWSSVRRIFSKKLNPQSSVRQSECTMSSTKSYRTWQGAADTSWHCGTWQSQRTDYHELASHSLQNSSWSWKEKNSNRHRYASPDGEWQVYGSSAVNLLPNKETIQDKEDAEATVSVQALATMQMLSSLRRTARLLVWNLRGSRVLNYAQ